MHIHSVVHTPVPDGNGKNSDTRTIDTVLQNTCHRCGLFFLMWALGPAPVHQMDTVT